MALGDVHDDAQVSAARADARDAAAFERRRGIFEDAGVERADLELAEWAHMYFGEDSGRYRRTIATKLYDEPIDIFDHHLYDKAGRVLHMLRMQLGDELFWKSLRHYLTKHRHGVVETRDLGDMMDIYYAAWERGVKTTYYLRTVGATVTQTMSNSWSAPRIRVTQPHVFRLLRMYFWSWTKNFESPIAAIP